MPAATSLSSRPAAVSADADLQQWLDALAGGTCPQDEFVDEILRREPADPEIIWEVLAQLDQYYRRKRIDHETYVCLKARFQRHSLGSGTDETMPRAPARKKDWHADPPMTAPWVDATEDEPELPEPAADAAEDTGPPPEPVEASFHREVRVGDVLCERYRVVDVLQKEDWTTYVEAIDESKVDLPGIRQRVMLQLVDESRSSDPLLVQRVGKLQALSHPSITRVLDVGEDCGVLVVVQEYFSGVVARDLLERGSGTSFQPAIAIVRSLASALSYAHARGVAHGDLHAGNVLITELGDVRLQGFELRAQHHTVQPSSDRLAFARLAHLLLTGVPAPVPYARLSGARRPSAVSRGQWRALRTALEGRSEASTEVLAAFGGPGPADEPLRAGAIAGGTPPSKRRRSHAGEWIAAGIVAAILGTGAYLYIGARDQPPEAAIVMTTDAAPAPTPVPQESPTPQDARTVPEAAPASIPDQGGTAAVATVVAEPPPPEAIVPVRPPPPPAARPDAASLARPSIDLAANFAWVDTSARVARVWVMRRGNVNREVTFRWWTETGTAEVDRDFRRIDPRVEIIPYGARGIELLVPLMPDPARREPRTFYVKIDEPGPGADLGPRTLMQVAIVPPGYPAARDTTALNLNAP